MKKLHNSKSPKYRDEDESYGDRKPRQRVKAIMQDKDAKRIERALKSKNYRMLSEEGLY